MFKKTILAVSFAAFGVLASVAVAIEPIEGDFWMQEVNAGNLPPVTERMPSVPLVPDLELRGREIGTQGGTLRTMVTRAKDVRQMVVYGYGRLVGYNERYEIVPDILESLENDKDLKFTMHLRKGHKWSDGHPFTSEDFRYWWEDVANNEMLSPAGPIDFMRVEGELPTVTFPDEYTVIYEWQK
ncbi:MAG: ABC transporter substrate-binding protein, partial [Shimia sp.]|nr:ABC transporter substrate-binding protein [Shimia sp.]